MKYLWLFLALIVSVPAFGAVEVKNGRVTANVQSELLRDVINQIGTLGGVQVSVDNSIANDMVYANFQDLPMGAAIRKLLEGTDINYAVVAGADGRPTAVYISKSETPGAPPKKLDSRPITSAPGRGVVTPVTPQPMPQPVMPQPAAPQPAFQQQNYQNIQQGNIQQQNIPQGGSAGRVAPVTQPKVINKQTADQKPNTSKPDSVPTAGSFSGIPPAPPQPVMNQPGTNQPNTAQPNRPPDNKPLIQNNPPPSQNNDSDDDDDDDDDDM
ncbi:MAG TPA: hypothetical protein VLR94_12145 [Acidobacteriota bacterium]|nr:hypothetical protein [Acidobacteriota bacterium]